MFGVLVVATSDGVIGYLRGFSGMVHGRWDIEGWVPPTFDLSSVWRLNRKFMPPFNVCEPLIVVKLSMN